MDSRCTYYKRVAEQQSKENERKLERKLRASMIYNQLLNEKMDELEIKVEDLKDQLQKARTEIKYLRNFYNHGPEFP